MTIIKGTKIEAACLRWLKNEIASDDKDSRESLHTLHVEQDVTVACNGYILGVIPTPECLVELAGKNVDGAIPSGDKNGFLADLETKDVHFPDYETLAKKDTAKPEVISIILDSDLLRSFLAGLPKESGVLFTIRADDQAVELATQDTEPKTRRWALLMPKLKRDPDKYNYSGINISSYWKPDFLKKEA
jgi:hypothetical protein